MEKAENAQFYPVQKKRLDCLLILLKWRGPETEDGERERVDLGSQDEVCSTAMLLKSACNLSETSNFI